LHFSLCGRALDATHTQPSFRNALYAETIHITSGYQICCATTILAPETQKQKSTPWNSEKSATQNRVRVHLHKHPTASDTIFAHIKSFNDGGRCAPLRHLRPIAPVMRHRKWGGGGAAPPPPPLGAQAVVAQTTLRQ
jgi:hypothetical protein